MVDYGGKKVKRECECGMFYVSQVQTCAPERFQTPLQRRVYETLEQLQIPFFRVDSDEAVAMEDCAAIERRLDVPMVKTLFLCGRKQRDFYLFVTAGDKPFRAGAFSAALGVARVSFAPMERMEEMLGVRTGAATLFSALLETAGGVRIVLDREICALTWIGCSDGTTTGYVKVRTEDVLRRLLPRAGREAEIIEV